jgi:pimeloyl-ACP methyl ester carboxylesterase
MGPPEHHRIDLHGAEMRYLDSGTGPTVALIHGLMSSADTWRLQVDEIADAGFRVVAPDLFGSGESAKPPGDYSLSAHAASLRDLFDRIGVGTAILVGHSLGGGTAMQFAYLFPDRVDGLVLVSSGGLGRDLNLVLRAATLPGSELVLPVLAAARVQGLGDRLLRTWATAHLPTINPGTIEGWRRLGSLADGATRRAFLASSRSVIDVTGQTVSAQAKLATMGAVPTMLVWGRRDRMIPPSHLETARRELPHSRVELLPHSGHFPHLDEPETFNRALLAFLREDVPSGDTGAGPVTEDAAEVDPTERPLAMG